jgi:NCAIR mutase (PurE)-related protein
MDQKALRCLLEEVKLGRIQIDEAFDKLKNLPYENLHFARLDHHRAIRSGYPEVVFCPGKQVEQIVAIIKHLAAEGGNVLATRATPEVFKAVQAVCPEAEYYELARVIAVRQQKVDSRGLVLVVSAGKADLPVAEEAAVVLELIGCGVERLYDVGVAGLHRLLEERERLYQAQVIIVVAGMEGALASVVGGLVDKPVIAVPTSVGYGASFGGLAALLAMLNSCAAGIGVVNIDNGFGAATLAAAIIRQVYNES